MDHPFPSHELKIINQPSGWVDGLGADARRAMRKIAHRDGGNEVLQRPHKLSLAQRAPEFLRTRAPVATPQVPDARECDRVNAIPKREVPGSVAFALEGQDCIRARVNPPIDAACEVDPEKWQRWVGHGVDEALDQ